MPKVINLHLTAGCVPKGVIRVDRRTKWGNPFIMGKDGSRQEVIEFYARFIAEVIEKEPKIMDLGELRDKDLACWCAPLPCHADILLELANR